MAHQHSAFSAASNGAQRNRRLSQPPQGTAPVFSVFPPQSFWAPVYQYRSNYQDFSPYEGYPYTCGFNVYYYNWNHAPYIMPPTRSNDGYQRQITNLETRDFVRIRRGGYVQEDETWVLNGIGQETGEDTMILGDDETWLFNGIGQETEEDTMVRGDDRLSEEVVSKYLKTKKGINHEVVGKDKDEEPEICVVCQDNLRQENQRIGILDCGHEFHACCIKKWLQRKNICPLCKAVAIVCR